MKFYKLQATGNEFILVDTFTQSLFLKVGESREGGTESRCKLDSHSLPIETSSGIKQDTAYVPMNKVKRAEVNMSLPQFKPERIAR